VRKRGIDGGGSPAGHGASGGWLYMLLVVEWGVLYVPVCVRVGVCVCVRCVRAGGASHALCLAGSPMG